MRLASLVEATAAGLGAALATGETFRRYWSRREARQQAAFRSAVREIVADELAPVMRRQADVIQRQKDSELRQGKHLDRQDKAIAELRRAVDRGASGRGG